PVVPESFQCVGHAHRVRRFGCSASNLFYSAGPRLPNHTSGTGQRRNWTGNRSGGSGSNALAGRLACPCGHRGPAWVVWMWLWGVFLVLLREANAILRYPGVPLVVPVEVVDEKAIPLRLQHLDGVPPRAQFCLGVGLRLDPVHIAEPILGDP